MKIFVFLPLFGRKTEGLIYNKLQRKLSIRIIYET